MRTKHLNKIITAVLFVGFVLVPVLTAGAKDNTKKKESLFSVDNFYDQTRHIMLKAERKIYKKLQDNESRLTFIKEFWQKRDPSPGTEENENQREYLRRIAFTNKYFRERTSRSKGWDSDRGRIYLLLGNPDERYPQPSVIADSMGHARRVQTEIWVYNYYRVAIRFVDENSMGVYRLRQYPPSLLNAIDRAKFEIHQQEWQDKKNKTELAFNTNVKQNELKILIPTKSISFKEDGTNVTAQFKVTVYVYLKHKRQNKIEATRDFNGNKKELLSQENLEVSVPFTPKKSGKYMLDIVVEDLSSGFRHRDIVSHKFKKI